MRHWARPTHGADVMFQMVFVKLPGKGRYGNPFTYGICSSKYIPNMRRIRGEPMDEVG